MAKSPVKQTKVPATIQRNWGWLLGLGIFLVLLGCIGLGMVVGLTLVSIVFLGGLFVIAGIAQIIDAFKSREWKGVFWHALVAFLYILGGGLIIYDPLLASTLITALIAWILIAMGIARLILGFSLRQSQGWFWFIVAGLTALILGILILMHWPLSGLWVIGLFIAIELIVSGWSCIFTAFAIRKA